MTVTRLIESIEDVSKRVKIAKENGEDLTSLEIEACEIATKFSAMQRIVGVSRKYEELYHFLREKERDVICLLDEFD